MSDINRPQKRVDQSEKGKRTLGAWIATSWWVGIAAVFIALAGFIATIIPALSNQGSPQPHSTPTVTVTPSTAITVTTPGFEIITTPVVLPSPFILNLSAIPPRIITAGTQALEPGSIDVSFAAVSNTSLNFTPGSGLEFSYLGALASSPSLAQCETNLSTEPLVVPGLTLRAGDRVCIGVGGTSQIISISVKSISGEDINLGITDWVKTKP